MALSTRELLLIIRTREDAQRAMAGIGREMRRLGAAADAAQMRAMAANARAHAAVLRNTGATKAQVASVLASAKAYDDQAKAIERNATRHERQASILSNVANTLMAAGIAGIAAGAAFAFGMKSAIDTAVEYERQVRLTYTQIDKRFKPSLEELGEIGKRVAREIAVPFEEIQPALFDIFSSTEANVKQAEILLTAFSKAAVAGQTDIQKAARGTIGIMNAFGVPLEDVNRILDLQFQLVQEGVGSYDEWAEKLGNISPSAIRAGQSIETMFASLIVATRLGLNTARATTAVSRAFDALSNPKAVAALKKFGVAVTDAEGNFRPFVDVMSDFRDRLRTMPQKGQLAAIEEILKVFKGAGSTIEARKFLQGVLLSKDGIEQLQAAMGELEGDTGAFQKAYEAMADTTASKSQLLSNKWMIVKETIGRHLLPAFNTLLDGLSKVLDWFGELPASTQKTIITLGLIAAGISLLGGVALLAIAGLGAFAIAISAITVPMLVVAGVFVVVAGYIAAMAGAFVYLYKKSAEFRGLISDYGDIIGTQFQRVKESFDTYLAPAFMALKHLWDTQLGPTLNQFVGKFRDEIVPKVREGARLVGDVLTVAMIFLAAIINSIIIPALLRLQEWYKKNENEIKRVGTALGFLVKWFLLVAAIIMGVVVVALALGLGGALTTAGALITFLSGRIRDIINVFRILWGVVQATIGHFSGLSAAARTTAGMIVGAFTSLPGRLYGIGVNAIRSMISGFFSQSGALQNAAASVARAAVAGAMGALRIGSPSKVFRDMGQNTVKSMALGLMDMKADLAATAADVFSLQNYVPNGQMSLGRVALGGGQGGALMPSNVRTFDQTINVSTNEIDPRRNAIELGWELEGRLR